MSAKHKNRYSIIRGGLLAGAIFSFVPAFALVRGSAGDSTTESSATAAAGRSSQPTDDDEDERALPSFSLPSQSSSTQSITPSQTRPNTTTQIQPRARTRAS